MNKFEKTLATLFFLSLPLWLVFTKQSQYGNEMPRYELLFIPLCFLLIAIIYSIWKK